MLSEALPNPNLNDISPSSNVVVGGKPSFYDNIWITNEYAACKMWQPWYDNSNLCCSTTLHICYQKTGTLFADRGEGKEKFEGTKHHALDDCKHQIKMLVKATGFHKTANDEFATSNSVADIQNAFSVATVPTEEQRLSDGNTTILNSLIESFYISRGTPLPLPESSELKASLTIQDIESQLQAITKIMDQSPRSQNLKIEQLFSETRFKKRKTEVGKEYPDDVEYSRTSTITATVDGLRFSKTSTTIDSNDSSKTTHVELFLDYGDDSDLENVFHSFSA